MHEEEINKLIDAKMETLIDKFEQCVVAARDTMPSSISTVITELRDEIREIKEQQSPMIDAFNMYNGVLNGLYLMAKVFGASGVIITTIYAIKKWILK